tara:strand:- start:1674 stop:2054 length:381 start_codon:yes stop_codon:yes gene_type:complete
MRTKQATATVNKEVEVVISVQQLGYGLHGKRGLPGTVTTSSYLVGFEITANIDVGSKHSRDTPGEPPSVDEWVDLKIQYIHYMDETSLTFGVLHNSDHKLFEQNILERAEEAGMEWVDDYDEEEYE